MTTLDSSDLTEIELDFTGFRIVHPFVTVKCRERSISTMRAKTLVALIITALMLTPVQAGDVTASQSEPAEDTRQPNANNTTMYMWSNDMATEWTHFNINETESAEAGELTEEKDNGIINIKYRFTMDPTLDKRLNMTIGEEIRGNFNVYWEGDIDNGGGGSCNNDCEYLNITVFRGANKVYQHTEQPWPAGNWKNIVFSYSITEEDGHNVWDSTNDNPVIEVTMKVKGDYQSGGFLGLQGSGDPAAFGFKLGEEARLELPIDESTWDEKFQAGMDDMPEEDTPGFTLVIASTAIAMAVFVNVGKEEENEA